MALALVNQTGRRTAHLVAVMSVSALVLTPGVATAGQAAGGSLAASVIGQVTDESGGVLPGVTVTTKSPALQVRQMESVTNEQGEIPAHSASVRDLRSGVLSPGFSERPRRGCSADCRVCRETRPDHEGRDR